MIVIVLCAPRIDQWMDVTQHINSAYCNLFAFICSRLPLFVWSFLALGHFDDADDVLTFQKELTPRIYGEIANNIKLNQTCFDRKNVIEFL